MCFVSVFISMCQFFFWIRLSSQTLLIPYAWCRKCLTFLQKVQNLGSIPRVWRIMFARLNWTPFRLEYFSGWLLKTVEGIKLLLIVGVLTAFFCYEKDAEHHDSLSNICPRCFSPCECGGSGVADFFSFFLCVCVFVCVLVSIGFCLF